MDLQRALVAFRHEARTLAWPGEALDAGPFVTRRSAAWGESVTAFALDEANAEAAIREQVSAGRPFEWKAYSFDGLPDLVDRLRVAGFEIGEREAVVVYDLAEGLQPFSGGGGAVGRIERVEELAEFREAAEAAFGKDCGTTTGELQEALRAGRRGHDAYLARMDGVPASVGRLYTNPQSDFAGLYGGGTRPEFRGRGLYRAVVAARARDAASLGARYLLVDALPTSLPILLRMGFAHLADTWPCEWAPA